jgi:uncharacterized protein (DUF2147 family)
MRALLIVAALLCAATPALAAPDPAFGEWLNEEGLARITIAPCSGDPALACGAVTWLKGAAGVPTRDVHNPDPAQRGKPLLGVLVIRDMKPQGPGRWVGGRVYQPQTGRTANGELKALSRNRLQVKGCILFVCESETFTRADEGAAAS